MKASYTGQYLRDLLVRRGVVPEARKERTAQEKRPAASGRLAGADAGGHPKREAKAESEGASKKSKKQAAE